MLQFEQNTTNGGVRLALQGTLGIDAAAAAMPGLLKAVAAHPQLEIDLSGVGAIDVAGLQLLLLAKREADRAGHSVQLCSHSPAVVELFELYRVAGLFGDPLVLPAASAGTGTAA